MEPPATLCHFEDEELLGRNLKWRRWPLAHYAVPFNLTNVQRGLYEKSIPALCRCAEAVAAAFASDAGLRALYGYAPEREPFILKEPGYRPLIPLGRFDSYLYEDRVKFLEYNTDGTAGWHYSGGLTALWREKAGLRPEMVPLQERLLEALLACYRSWSNGGLPGNIAIVDWHNVGTRPEQEALRLLFESKGFNATIEEPAELGFKSGRLEGSKGAVDLVYRRAVSEELFARAPSVAPFLRAYEAGAFCCAGSFRTDPAWSKTLFAVLSDPNWRHLFAKRDHEILDEVIPWTRLIRPGMDGTAQGKELRSEILSGRSRFILKPANSYQGAGVHAGPLLSQEAWRHAVDQAFAKGAWVAQEYLEPVEWLPPAGGAKHFIQVGAFALMGRWAGLMARVCETPVITPDSLDKFLPVGEEMPWELLLKEEIP